MLTENYCVRIDIMNLCQSNVSYCAYPEKIYTILQTFPLPLPAELEPIIYSFGEKTKALTLLITSNHKCSSKNICIWCSW